MAEKDVDKSRYMREAAIVNRYLAIVDSRRGRRVSPDEVQRRVDEINNTLQTGVVTWVKRIDLTQERRNLLEQLEDDEDAAETAFVEIIAEWAERRGISYGTLREVGVPAAVLRAAGITGDG